MLNFGKSNHVVRTTVRFKLKLEMHRNMMTKETDQLLSLFWRHGIVNWCGHCGKPTPWVPTHTCVEKCHVHLNLHSESTQRH